jgi:peroxiredoxin
MKELLEVDWSKIPPPADDSAADHLRGLAMPAILLPSTDGSRVDLSGLIGRSVVYAYPRTGEPGQPLPKNWDLIPGARGCTPQACAFRDHFAELKALGVASVFGLSTQDTAYQREVATRLHLPFPLLSDAAFQLTDAIRLPTFSAAGMRLLCRLTMIIRSGRIEHVIYPVFPPDQNAQAVIDWLRTC